MLVDFDADTNAPLLEVYGQPVTWLGPTGVVAAPPLVGIFERHHEIILQEIKGSELDAPGHSTTAPVLTVMLQHFSTKPKIGDRLTIGVETFSVYDVQPDGHGMTDLVLKVV